MSENSIVVKILKELSGRETIKKTDSLQNDLALDSLGMVTLLLEIEDAFDIKLTESDMNPFDLIIVEDVLRLVEKYVGDNNES